MSQSQGRALVWRVGALLIGSGCCALIYQTGWLREFRLIFGASTAASAAVLAIFIGGLGVGGLLLGGKADAHRRPLLLYAKLEAIVAVSAALSPLLLAVVRALYIALGGTARLGLIFGTLSRLVLSALVLGIPTVAMGGTLPAAARSVTRSGDARRQDVAALYALNTLGAVAGCFVATFFMLEAFGTRQTLWLAAAVNLLVALLARQLTTSIQPAETTSIQSVETASIQPAKTIQAPSWFVLLASLVVGFVFFLMELVWYRMLGPLLGGSVFTFGLILAIALAGIGLGGLVYAVVAGDRPATPTAFGWTCLLEAAAIAAAYALGDRVAVLSLVVQPLGNASFAAQVSGWTAVTALVVLPASIVAGYQFPLLIALLGRGRERVGREIGLAYATNTLGAIVGALAGGFGLLPWLSAPGAWRFAVLSLVALGAAAAATASLRGMSRALVPQAALAIATLVMLMATGPTAVWRHAGIGSGRAGIVTVASANALKDWSHAERRAVVWDGDGTESSVALSEDPSGYAFVVNGRVDGSARRDAGTQVMSGLLGPIINPRARRSLVIGLGTGSTAGWLGAIPSMERVDVVELEPLILEIARACRAVNRAVMENPKVHIALGDAREALLTSKDQYDVIASEPSNPFRAGIASLFTHEYYRAASDRLGPDGLFIQWVQAYEIDARTLRTIYATMASVFPYVETWQTSVGDLMLVGGKHAPAIKASELAARIAEEPFKSALRDVWRAVDLNGLFAHYIASDALTRAVAGAPSVDINTDDRNVVEFGFARSVGKRSTGLAASVRQLADALQSRRPPLDNSGAIDWPAVETAWVSYQAGEGTVSSSSPASDRGPEAMRRMALLSFYRDHDAQAARRAWEQQPASPRDPNELAMMAEVEALAASDQALPWIGELRRHNLAEADTILAILRLCQARFDEAATALEGAFEHLRANPWPLFRLKQQAVDMAAVIGAASPVLARRMFDALKEPFALDAMREQRLFTQATLARMVDFKGLCREAIAPLEAHVPWTEGFLSMRRECYAAAGDAHVESAIRDLVYFRSREPLPVGFGVSRQP